MDRDSRLGVDDTAKMWSRNLTKSNILHSCLPQVTLKILGISQRVGDIVCAVNYGDGAVDLSVVYD